VPDEKPAARLARSLPDHVVQHCKAGSCRLSLARCGRTVVVNTERAALRKHAGGPISDFAVAVDGLPADAFVLVEMKSGTVDVSDATRQLQGGADLLGANSITPLASERVVPLILAAGGLHAAQLLTLRNRRLSVSWGGRRHSVVCRHCGIGIWDLRL
jgi:hypothetical protein